MDPRRPRRPVLTQRVGDKRALAQPPSHSPYLSAVASGNERPLGVLAHCRHDGGNLLIQEQGRRVSLLHTG